MASNINPKLKEEVSFIQHQLPGLEDGEYTITINHEFHGDSDILPGMDKSEELVYKFGVAGPRFKPFPTLVYNVFPPRNSQGNYSTLLPHIILNNKALPWMRDPCGADDTVKKGAFNSQGQPGKKIDLDVPSWLAILLLTPNDYQNSDIPFGLKSTKQSSLFPANPGTGSFISPVFKEKISDQPSWFKPNENCNAIKIPMDVFSGIAPSMADLYTMATVMKVSTEQDNLALDSTIIDTNDLGTHTVIFGNRLPISGVQNTAILVSLEGMQDYLPDHNGQPSSKIPSTVKYAYLPVFDSWNFIPSKETYQFDHLLNQLNEQNVSTPDPHKLPNARLRVPPKNSESQIPTSAKRAIDLGYVPLTHSMRNGVKTASWYRGPLVPVPTKTQNISPHSDADSLVRFNPDTGLFDVSYAAAWQLGKLLALQDQNYSTTLFNWKEQQAQNLVGYLEERALQETFGNVEQLVTAIKNGINEKDQISPEQGENHVLHSLPFSRSTVTGPTPLSEKVSLDESSTKQSLLETALALLIQQVNQK